ncbi:hypothetical protein DAPPUDRAFT_276568, partial [Daphnia pulex]
IFTEEDQLFIVGMDCDADYLFTMSINSPYLVARPHVSTIFVRELQSGEVVCFGHRLLVSYHFLSKQQKGKLILHDDVPKSRLDVWRMKNARDIEAKGTVCLGPIPKSRSYGFPNRVFIGNDENFLVVHRINPPCFEVISTSSLKLTRTIDGMGRGNGFTTNYLVTVTNVSLDQGDKRSVINIRDLSIAMDLHSSQTSTSAVLATRELGYDISSDDCFIVDDFQLSFAPEV